MGRFFSGAESIKIHVQLIGSPLFIIKTYFQFDFDHIPISA